MQKKRGDFYWYLQFDQSAEKMGQITLLCNFIHLQKKWDKYHWNMQFDPSAEKMGQILFYIQIDINAEK